MIYGNNVTFIRACQILAGGSMNWSFLSGWLQTAAPVPIVPYVLLCCAPEKTYRAGL